MKSWLFRAALLVPLLLLLAILEIGARVAAFYNDATLQRGLEDVGQAADGNEFSLQHIIRWHDNPKLIYELVPGLSGSFRGAALSINDAGFRGPPLMPEKPADAFRVLGLGDSVMFGWGVGDHEFYLARLGELLQSAMPQRQVQWLNSAVPGYNTVNEVETLERKLLGYGPDVVILDYVRNDLHVPGFLRKSQPYFSLRESFLARWVRNSLRGLHTPDQGLERPPDAFRREDFVGQEHLIPEEYRSVIGMPAFRAAAARLRELADQHGFRVIVVAHYGFDEQPLAVFDSLGFEVVDGYPRVQAFLRAQGITQYAGSDLAVGDGDAHPSALLHGMIAEWLAEQILAVP